MRSPEANLSPLEQSIRHSFQTGYDQAKNVMESFGCRGPAQEAYGDMLDGQRWAVYDTEEDDTPSRIIRPGYDPELKFPEKPIRVIGRHLAGSFSANGVEVKNNYLWHLAVTHNAAIAATSLFPTQLAGVEDLTIGERISYMDVFFENILDEHPEENIELPIDVIGHTDIIQQRFMYGVAQTALKHMLEDGYDSQGTDILNTYVESFRPYPAANPLDSEIIKHYVGAASLRYNLKYFEI